MKSSTRQRAITLAGRLHMPAGELIELVAHAGLAALESTLENQGRLTLPLQLATTGDIVPFSANIDVTPLFRTTSEGSPFMVEVAHPDPPPPVPRPEHMSLHQNSNAYAHALAAYLRDRFGEKTAAYMYRAARDRDIPPPPAAEIEKVAVKRRRAKG